MSRTWRYLEDVLEDLTPAGLIAYRALAELGGRATSEDVAARSGLGEHVVLRELFTMDLWHLVKEGPKGVWNLYWRWRPAPVKRSRRARG